MPCGVRLLHHVRAADGLQVGLFLPAGHVRHDAAAVLLGHVRRHDGAPVARVLRHLHRGVLLPAREHEWHGGALLGQRRVLPASSSRSRLVSGAWHTVARFPLAKVSEWLVVAGAFFVHLREIHACRGCFVARFVCLLRTCECVLSWHMQLLGPVFIRGAAACMLAFGTCFVFARALLLTRCNSHARVLSRNIPLTRSHRRHTNTNTHTHTLAHKTHTKTQTHAITHAQARTHTHTHTRTQHAITPPSQLVLPLFGNCFASCWPNCLTPACAARQCRWRRATTRSPWAA